MMRNGVPEHHPALGAQLAQHAVDDRPRRLAPAARAIAGGAKRRPPAQQVALAGERDPRPAHALIAGRLAQRDDVGGAPLVEVVAQVGQPLGAARPAVLIVRRADAGGGQIS